MSVPKSTKVTKHSWQKVQTFLSVEHIGSVISYVNSFESQISSSVGFTCDGLQQTGGISSKSVNVYSRTHLVCMTILSVLFIQVRIVQYLIDMSST